MQSSLWLFWRSVGWIWWCRKRKNQSKHVLANGCIFQNINKHILILFSISQSSRIFNDGSQLHIIDNVERFEAKETSFLHVPGYSY
jgi:hypothetical protein